MPPVEARNEGSKNPAEILAAATGLVARDGLWLTNKESSQALSFPDGSHDALFQVEEKSFWFQHRNNCIVQALNRYPPPGVLLDVGGGNGMVAKRLQAEGVPVILVEPFAQGVSNARTRGIRHIVCGTLQEAGFGRGSLGGVAFFDVIEHLENDGEDLAKARQLLAPGGRLYLTVPAWQWLWSEMDNESGHCRRYSPEGLRKTVADAGYEIEYLTFFFSLLPLPMLVCRRLQGLRNRLNRKKAATSLSEHSPGGILEALAGRIWAMEGSLLKRGVRLPFGASLLLVARAGGA